MAGTEHHAPRAAVIPQRPQSPARVPTVQAGIGHSTPHSPLPAACQEATARTHSTHVQHFSQPALFPGAMQGCTAAQHEVWSSSAHLAP